MITGYDPPMGAVPTECDPSDGQEVSLATLGLTLLVPRGADRAGRLPKKGGEQSRCD